MKGKVVMMSNKIEALKRLSNENGVIAALAIDQRGSLKKMLAQAANKESNEEDIVEFKKVISKELTPYASAILLSAFEQIPVRSDHSNMVLPQSLY